MVPREAEIEGQAGFARVADGRDIARVRYRYDHIRIDAARVLRREGLSQEDARGMDRPAEDLGVGPGEIDELEDASLGGQPGFQEKGAFAFVVEHDDLARLDFPVFLGRQGVQGASLGSDEDSPARSPDI